MSDTLHYLVLLVEAEHEQLDRLIAKITRHQMHCGDDPDDPSSHILCRDSIRYTLGSYLKLTCEHFEHEHELMRKISFPKALLEDHAVEHDAILDGVNRVIRDFGAGLSNALLLTALEDLCMTFQKHSEGFDKTLYRYLDECFPHLRVAPMSRNNSDANSL